MIRARKLAGSKTFEVDENECIDIDTINDFVYAQSMYIKGLI